MDGIDKKGIKDKTGIKYVIAFICTMVFLTVLFVYWADGKRVTFCDEIYTYNIVNSDGLTHYEINKWMSGEDFKKALTHSDDDYYGRMIENIKMDKVHPPLYYILVYMSSKLYSKFIGNDISTWVGLIVNLLAFLGTGCIVFLILKKLFDSPVLSGLGTAGLLWTQCMISAAMLIRMYMVYTFFTALYAYASLLIADRRKREGGRAAAVACEAGKYVLLCLAAVGGFMTQYYFVFFAIIFLGFEIIYDIKDKKYINILKYLAALIIAAVLINGMWNYWYTAITSNAHSAGVIGNAKGFFMHLEKIYDGYKLVITYVFQRAYKPFLIILPALVIAFFIVVWEEKYSLVRSFVARIFGVAIVYAFVVNVLTPETLSSTRYYYADMMLILMVYIICIFAIAERLIKADSKIKSIAMSGVGAAVVVLNVILLTMGFGIDYYPDKKEYDSNTAALEAYADIPWIIGWDLGWEIDTAMFDYSIPDRIMPMNINASVDAGTFDGVDEFILAQCNEEDSEQITQKNLYNYIITTGKNVESEKIADIGYVSFYYCSAVEDDGRNQETVNKFMEDYKDTPWLVINNDGWYDAKEIFPEGEPENVIFIDKNTQYDDTGALDECDMAAILVSVYGGDELDAGLYYMIGSTGRFFEGSYVGTADNGAVIVYRCNAVNE